LRFMRIGWLILILLLAACSGGSNLASVATRTVQATATPTTTTLTTATPSTAPVQPTTTPVPAPTSTPMPTPTPRPPHFAVTQTLPSHIFIILLENSEESEIMGNPDLPYINLLASQYAVSDNYYAITHPSLPNYLALISGHTFGIDQDCIDCFQNEPNLADTLEAKGKTWKSYQEDMPQPCFLDAFVGHEYVIRHNPFAYFQNVRTNPDRCKRMVPLTQLDEDLRSGDVPDFAWITPNLRHDGHDPESKPVDADRWLTTFVPKILASDAYKKDGMLIITWDEGSTKHTCCGLTSQGGQIPLIVASAAGPHGYHSTIEGRHYSLLRTIEDLWGLDHLGHTNDATVEPICDLFLPFAQCQPDSG
jgi:hypothetical protein